MTEIYHNSDNSGNVPKKKMNRYLNIGIVFYFSVFVILIVLAFLTLRESVILNNDRVPLQVTICNPKIRDYVFLLLYYNFALLIGFSLFFLILRRMGLALISLNIVLFGFPAFMGWGLFSGPWMIVDHAMGPDGKNYYYMGHGALMGYTKSLATLKYQTKLTMTFQVLSDNDDEHAFILRPASLPRDKNQKIMITKSGLVLGMYDANCYLAYDISTGRAWGWKSDFSELSPFLLLDSSEQPYPPDVLELYDNMEKGYNIPKTTLIEAGLKDPNPNVREIARKLLELKDNYDKLNKRR